MKEHNYFVYMIASKSRVLYIGMTSNLHRRVAEHKSDLIEGFSKDYKCHRLVYFQSFDDVNKAIDREKQLKRWNRTKKEWLIAQRNPTWEDLSAEWHLRHQFQPERRFRINPRELAKKRFIPSGVEGRRVCLQCRCAGGESRSLHAPVDRLRRSTDLVGMTGL
jgi:putative endonuclease